MNCTYFGERELVGVLMLNQEGASQTCQSVFGNFTEYLKSSVGCHSRQRRKKQPACLAANVFFGSVAT